MPLYLGLDFGGTKLAAGVADDRGNLLASGRRATVPETGATGALDGISRIVADFGALIDQIVAVGISFGGPVDPTLTRTLLSHHGPGWSDVPLVERITNIYHRPTAMDNDANAAALGEWRVGAARGTSNALYLTVSTGIGGGVIIDGRIYRGSRGLAGEIGHLVVVPDGPECACGKRGCLEAVAAGPAIARAYLARSPDQPDLTAADVFRLASLGDAAAQQVVANAIHHLGVGIAGAINLLDPDIVVVGGGVSRAGDALFRPLREEVRAASLYQPLAGDIVVPAALGDAVGILGAIALVADTGVPRSIVPSSQLPTNGR